MILDFSNPVKITKTGICFNPIPGQSKKYPSHLLNKNYHAMTGRVLW
jgi:hypothetical protein